MNQTIDYKKLPFHIGTILSYILIIVGFVFMFVAMIEMKEYGTIERDPRFIDSHDYDLMIMKTYGIAMVIGGFIAWFANIILTVIKPAVKNEKNTEASSVCAICGAKSTRLKTVTVGDNEKIRLCPQCCSEENEK